MIYRYGTKAGLLTRLRVGDLRIDQSLESQELVASSEVVQCSMSNTSERARRVSKTHERL